MLRRTFRYYRYRALKALHGVRMKFNLFLWAFSHAATDP